jgi:ferric-dicitrate binding protein FerR (iron transport regulator)
MGEIMNTSGENRTVRHSDAVESLLSRARPRPAPPAADERDVREAVYAEWQGVTVRRRSRRRLLRFAAAASLVLAAVISVSLLRDTGVAPVEVAAITKSHGRIYLLGEQSELNDLPGQGTVLAGQTIVTGDDAGIGLDWGSGGSLRIDEETAVEFASGNSIYLRNGRVYFDSHTDQGRATLSIATDHGEISHIGTQYMAAVDTRTLVVSVREGEVTVDRYSGTDRASAGQRLEFVGDARPSVSNISATGSQWAWTEATAPTLDFSGKTTYEFLRWVGRETGYDVVFESARAESLARQGRLIGTIPGLDPRGELEVRMLGEDLDYTFDRGSGTLRISSIGSGR